MAPANETSTGELPKMKPENDGRAASGDPDQLAQIQEILVGNQMRETETRLGRLAERTRNEIEDVRAAAEQRMRKIETRSEKEMEAIGEQLEAVRTEQVQAAESIIQRLKDLTDALEKRLGQLDQKMTESENKLRELVLDEGKQLRHEQLELRSQQEAALAQEAQQLREAKADRGTLSALFREVATRLTDVEASEDD